MGITALVLLFTSRILRAEEPSVAVVPEHVARAEELAAQAYNAYVGKNFRRAVSLYEEALQAASGANIIYNLAHLYDASLHERRQAIAYYRRYLLQAAATRSRSDYARLRLKELRESLPLAVKNQPKAPGGREAVDMPQTLQEEVGWTRREMVSTAVAGAGAMGLIASAGFALSAHSKRSTWAAQCEGNLCDSQQGVDALRDAANLANVATVALIAGASVVGLGASLYWLSAGGSDSTGITFRVELPTESAGLGCLLNGQF